MFVFKVAFFFFFWRRGQFSPCFLGLLQVLDPPLCWTDLRTHNFQPLYFLRPKEESWLAHQSA